ncbi:MAG: ABC transporter permease [Candidatus Daviesbacteria bacterium]|nr:ABC transporter permease [Candidatus Daviesbacteria bacterium]
MNFNRVFAIVLRHIFTTMHQLERFFDVIISPVLVLILWGFLSKYVQNIQSQQLAAFLLGGMILWVVFEKVSTDIGVNFMFEIWDRNIINLLASPITFWEFLTGLLTISFIKIIIALISMWLMAGIFYNFQITSLGFGLALLWINLFIFAVSFGIFNVSLVLRYGHSIGPLTWILPFFVQPFAAVFYPVNILPPFFQKIAWVIPISHVFEGMRYTLKFGQFDFNSFWLATLLNMAYMAGSVAFFTFIFKKVLKSGRLVKLI